MKTMSFKAEDSLCEALKEKAHEEYETVSEVIRKAIWQYIMNNPKEKRDNE